MATKRWIRILCMLLVVLVCLPMPVARAETASRLAIERQIYNYLTEEMGLNTAVACGILANVEIESSFSLTALGDSGTSYGLFQWHEERYSALVAYCSSRSLDYRTLEGQMEYLYYELRTTYVSLYGQLKAIENSAKGAYQAGYLWCIRFERPADMESKGVTRGNLAQYKYWNRYSSLAVQEPAAVEEFTSDLIEQAQQEQQDQQQSTSSDTSARVAESSEEIEDESGTTLVSQTRRLQFKSYVPRHTPTQPEEEDWALGICMGFLFMTLGDGGKRRGGQILIPEAEELPEDAPEMEDSKAQSPFPMTASIALPQQSFS